MNEREKKEETSEESRKKYSRQSRPRCEWHWEGAWSSATTSTTARCGVEGIFSDFSGQPQGPSVVLEVSCTLYETDNLWCKPASKTQSCRDVRHGALPSDPRLRHGRIPIFFREQKESRILKQIVRRKYFSRCTWIIYHDNKVRNNQFIKSLTIR